MFDSSGPEESKIRDSLTQAGLKIRPCAWTYSSQAHNTELNCDLRWRAEAYQSESLSVIHTLAAHPGVIKIARTPKRDNG